MRAEERAAARRRQKKARKRRRSIANVWEAEQEKEEISHRPAESELPAE